MTLPARRPKTVSNILRGPKREWPRHRKWLRGFYCVVPGCQDGPIEVAHVRQGHQAGTGIKPADWSAIPCCAAHHREQHAIGHQAFDRKYAINSLALAKEFAAKSPDSAMREAMQENTP